MIYRACLNCRNPFKQTCAEACCSAACARTRDGQTIGSAQSCDLCGATHADGVALVMDGDRRLCVDCIGRAA